MRLEDGRRYLCGDAFTAADLAFAALAAPVIVPPEYGTPLPAPDELPAEMAAGVRAFRAHPAGEFASRLFREERCSGAVDGQQADDRYRGRLADARDVDDGRDPGGGQRGHGGR